MKRFLHVFLFNAIVKGEEEFDREEFAKHVTGGVLNTVEELLEKNQEE